jgi:hypothetical protein
VLLEASGLAATSAAMLCLLRVCCLCCGPWGLPGPISPLHLHSPALWHVCFSAQCRVYEAFQTVKYFEETHCLNLQVALGWRCAGWPVTKMAHGWSNSMLSICCYSLQCAALLFEGIMLACPAQAM